MTVHSQNSTLRKIPNTEFGFAIVGMAHSVVPRVREAEELLGQNFMDVNMSTKLQAHDLDWLKQELNGWGQKEVVTFLAKQPGTLAFPGGPPFTRGAYPLYRNRTIAAAKKRPTARTALINL